MAEPTILGNGYFRCHECLAPVTESAGFVVEIFGKVEYRCKTHSDITEGGNADADPRAKLWKMKEWLIKRPHG
jgi:hypothetical protein